MAVEPGRRRALFRDKLPQERCRAGRSPAPEASRDMAQTPSPPSLWGWSITRASSLLTRTRESQRLVSHPQRVY